MATDRSAPAEGSTRTALASSARRRREPERQPCLARLVHPFHFDCFCTPPLWARAHADTQDRDRAHAPFSRAHSAAGRAHLHPPRAHAEKSERFRCAHGPQHKGSHGVPSRYVISHDSEARARQSIRDRPRPVSLMLGHRQSEQVLGHPLGSETELLGNVAHHHPLPTQPGEHFTQHL